MEPAFCKGFRLVFESGEGLIGKTYDADQLCGHMEQYAAAVRTKATGARLRRFSAARGRLVRGGGTGVALAEGAARWACWGSACRIIPLFLGGLLRGVLTVSRLAMALIVTATGAPLPALLVAASLSKGEGARAGLRRPRRRWAAGGAVTLFGGMGMDAAGPDGLAEEMLTAKFVQGLPLVGSGKVCGMFGYRRVTACAARAYERRWLEQENRGKIADAPQVWLGCVFPCDRAQIGAYRDLVADKVKQREHQHGKRDAPYSTSGVSIEMTHEGGEERRGERNMQQGPAQRRRN